MRRIANIRSKLYASEFTFWSDSTILKWKSLKCMQQKKKKHSATKPSNDDALEIRALHTFKLNARVKMASSNQLVVSAWLHTGSTEISSQCNIENLLTFFDGSFQCVWSSLSLRLLLLHLYYLSPLSHTLRMTWLTCKIFRCVNIVRNSLTLESLDGTMKKLSGVNKMTADSRVLTIMHFMCFRIVAECWRVQRWISGCWVCTTALRRYVDNRNSNNCRRRLFSRLYFCVRGSFSNLAILGNSYRNTPANVKIFF